MLQDIIVLTVKTAADISTKTTQTLALVDDLGFTIAQAADLEPRIINKRGANGVGKVTDEVVAIAAATGILTITEGTSGLTAGDLYTIALIRGVSLVTATAGES